MRWEQVTENVIPFPHRHSWKRSLDVGDLRFRRLLGEGAWWRLPEAVQARFGKHLGGGRTVLYAGEIVECRMSLIGRSIALAARLIGGPLPISRDVWVPAVVSVTEDPASGGQFWTRIYGRRRGFPQVIHSAKRFAGPTGLEEYIGWGIGIALVVSAENGALHFLSDHYFMTFGRLRLRLPHWLTPGRMQVSHVDCGSGGFAFVFSLVHPLFGELVHQTAMFNDAGANDRL